MREKIEQRIGLWRSLAIYYFPGRLRRLRRFYASYIRHGDLCFDIGAHVGNRIAAWTQLGARVVAVEPHPHLMDWLARRFGRSPSVSLVRAAVGAQPGTALLRHDPRNLTVATLSDAWIAAVSRDSSFAGVRWRAAEPVNLTTLDALIDAYGRPALCKIDVEGYEVEALSGLSQAIPLVSFEYIPAAIEVAHTCLERLISLGEYEFNWFAGESHRWASPAWLSAKEMSARLVALAGGRSSGDVFARLQSAEPGT